MTTHKKLLLVTALGFSFCIQADLPENIKQRVNNEQTYYEHIKKCLPNSDECVHVLRAHLTKATNPCSKAGSELRNQQIIDMPSIFKPEDLGEEDRKTLDSEKAPSIDKMTNAAKKHREIQGISAPENFDTLLAKKELSIEEATSEELEQLQQGKTRYYTQDGLSEGCILTAEIPIDTSDMKTTKSRLKATGRALEDVERESVKSMLTGMNYARKYYNATTEEEKDEHIENYFKEFKEKDNRYKEHPLLKEFWKNEIPTKEEYKKILESYDQKSQDEIKSWLKFNSYYYSVITIIKAEKLYHWLQDRIS